MLLYRVVLPAAAAFSVSLLSTSVMPNENVHLASSQDTRAAATARHIAPTTGHRRTLIAYYSLTGKTHAVAQALAGELHADVRRIEDEKKQDPKYSWWFVVERGFAAIRGEEAKIKPIDANVEEYDRLFIGTPVWCVLLLLCAINLPFLTVIYFCTPPLSPSPLINMCTKYHEHILSINLEDDHFLRH